jgi:tetratricopeptide (TPR) repeat protein
MLAFLSLKGGHVIEATVYGEMATRVGNPEANMTRDAAFIALTAAQEASSTHWGGEGEVGALLQMQTIAELIDAKWPAEAERDAIWLSLAQSYAEFGKTELAIKAYSNIRKTSPLFGEAQFGAGIAHWNTFLNEASRPQVKEQAMLSRLNKATQALAGGVEAIEARSDNPTLALLVGKQTLAMIADRTGDWKSVKAWMTEGKFPLVRSITLETASTPGKPSKSRQPAPVVVSRALAKNVFVLLYEAATEAGDFPTAKQSLERFQSLIGDEADPDIASMRFSTAVQQIKNLIDQNSIGSQDVKLLDETLSSVLSSKSTTPDEKLWIAQSWATLAGKKNAAVVSNSCYQRAAAICDQAIETKGFPKTSLPATRLRQAEWLRMAGDYEESLQVVSELLTSSPNALDVQLQAALSLEAFAIARDTEADLLRVIDTTNSTDDDKSRDNSSAIWGWNKLTSQLHQVRYSNKGTSQHGNLLLMAHFHLARSRWMLMSVTDEGADRDKLKARIANQLKSAKLAIPLESPDANTWQAAFENLESKLTP